MNLHQASIRLHKSGMTIKQSGSTYIVAHMAKDNTKEESLYVYASSYRTGSIRDAVLTGEDMSKQKRWNKERAQQRNA